MAVSQATPEDGEYRVGAAVAPLFAIAHDPLCLLDSRGRVREVNAAFSRLFGYQAEETAGVAFLEWIHAEDRKTCIAMLGAAVTGQETVTFNARLRDQSGDYRPMVWNVAGQSGQLFLAGQPAPPAPSRDPDVRQNELLAILDAAPDLMGVLDGDGMTLLLNQAGRELLGYGPADDLSSLHISAYVTGEERQRIERNGLPAAGEHGIWSGDTVLRATNGQETPVSLVIMAHKDESEEVRRFSVTGRDISARRRTEELSSRQATSLETVAEISTASATLVEVDRLLQEVVDVTKERFDLYHAHVYLLNAAGDALELVAGAGQVGRTMVEQGHRLPLETPDSPVAQAARSRRSVTVDDVQSEGAFLLHPQLPETRAEMALPMFVGGQLAGVLDVQDKRAGRFDEADLNIFNALASQVAVAVENARSFARAQATVTETNVLMRRLTREGWEDYLREQSPMLAARGFLFDAERISPVSPLESEAPALEADGRAVLAETLQIHDQVVGQLALVAQDGAFDDEAAELVAAIAAQLSARIENLRLTNETQLALSETAALYRAGTDLNRARSYEEVLDVMREHSVAGRDASAVALVLFDQPWTTDSKPGRLDVAAFWSAFKLTDEPLSEFTPLLSPIGELLNPDGPTFVADVEHDAVLASGVRQFYAGTLRGKSALFAPLVVGGQWIGYLTTAFNEERDVAESELRRLQTLVGQASVAIQSISLLQAAQKRARQERVLREVSTRVRSVTDVDLIMKTAVREIGQALGRETFLYLGDEQAAAVDTGDNQTGQEAN
jgi:PAS domain S-box-containing protein